MLGRIPVSPAWRLGLTLLGLSACSFDRGDRWSLPPNSEAPRACLVGDVRCAPQLERCVDGPDGPRYVAHEDCSARQQVCSTVLAACAECDPGTLRCSGTDVERCDDDGARFDFVKSCDEDAGLVCRAGTCANLCGGAAVEKSNVGCEYWAVDLDNANVGLTLNAAEQQFAVVVSNPQPDVAARVIVERDDTAPGESNDAVTVADVRVSPLALRVFKLGPREVDGSSPGTYDTGTHTALTRAAYRIRSSVPVVAYQFNPLENTGVFSNDASLLKPVEALTDATTGRSSYVVLGWPQTIAITDDPNTNFSRGSPTSLRAFLTIVGTREKTEVSIQTRAGVVQGGPVAATAPGDTIEITLDPFDVLNLETEAFNADFTGSLIEATAPVVVFSGNEASDAPFFLARGERQCCADHLEEQLDPIRTAGRRFVASVTANRTAAVALAGATIGIVEQTEFFRVIAVTDAGARIKTTLDDEQASIRLHGLGDFAQLESTRHFTLESDAPVMLGHVTPSQEAAGVPRGLPGGDPSFVIIPPTEQYRSHYVFLTPDRYSFDFLRIIAPPGANVSLDTEPVTALDTCTALPGDGLDINALRGGPPDFLVHGCQLSFPIIDPTMGANEPLRDGVQNDGVHVIESDEPVGVMVGGFDRNVSYGYAAGTELREIVIQ